MKSIGLLISHKNNEKRRALLPQEFGLLEHGDCLLFEHNYGLALGIEDAAYKSMGARFAPRSEVLKQDIIVDVKLGDADYIGDLEPGKLLFGWAHALRGVDFTSKVLEGNHSVIAWEEMYDEGRYIFYRNREIAGEAAILHAYPYCGRMPYETRVAIIGNGQTARGALRILHGLGAEVDVFNRRQESLFKRTMFDYDVIVNCVMWDTSRTDRLIYKEDLPKFAPGTFIIDITCNSGLEIETSHATTIDNPVYEIDGILHYAVDNTPAMFSKTVTRILSKTLAPYYDQLVTGHYNDVLRSSIIIENGHIIQACINEFRIRHNLFVK